MRKEVLWAAVAGISFGLIIAFGVFRVNSTLKPKGGSTQATPTPNPGASEFKITLAKPENEDVVTEDVVAVSGITKPLVWITVSGEKGDYIIQADEKGFFEEEVDLISGVNQIKLTAFDPQGNQSIEKVLVVYSSSFERGSPARPPLQGEASESSIREKVQQKVEEALNKPKAYLGTVTDITDSTIQVKTTSGEIRQISVKEGEVTVVKTGAQNKEVKLTDIAIGDFIVGMGYKNGNQVLSAQRILITSPVTEPKVTAIWAKGKDLNEKDVTSKTKIFTAKDGKVTKTKLANIEDESQIIYVTTEVDGKTGVRTIFII